MVLPEHANDLWIYADTFVIKNLVWLPGKHVKIVANHISFAPGASLNVDGKPGKNNFPILNHNPKKYRDSPFG